MEKGSSTLYCRHCDHKWTFFCVEWPPRVTICTKCGLPLKLEAYDPKNGRVTYRRINP